MRCGRYERYVFVLVDDAPWTRLGPQSLELQVALDAQSFGTRQAVMTLKRTRPCLASRSLAQRNVKLAPLIV
jgi:hypothetical protein